jgi:ABC transport system ATP-binding/permease protein
VIASGARVAYLPQNPQLDGQSTVLEQVFLGDAPATRLLRRYEQLAARLAATPDDATLQAQLADLLPQMDAADAWSAESAARTVLERLGLGAMLDHRVDVLSGGQRKRVAMAQALIDRPELLILDEPTNHVDTETIAWLEEELGRYSGALLLVTHDRYFLDRVVTRMLEVERGNVTFYTGGYSSYLEHKAAQAVRAEAQEEARQNLLRRELAWLRRGARARSTKQKAHVERVRDLMQQSGPERPRELELATMAGRRLGTKVLKLDQVAQRYGAHELIRPWSYTVEPGDRIGIVGPNGSGKTTLLNIIAGRVTPTSGMVELGETVQLAYYDQESAGLNEAQRVIDYIKEAAEVIATADGQTASATQMLERFLFVGSDQYTPISRLSGGERRRLYLLRTLMLAPNVLLLDEPTNDLDIQTLTILEDYLEDWRGTLITVSHDRYFLDRTTERVLAFEGDGRIVEYPGYAAYHERQQQVRQADRHASQKRAASSTTASGPSVAATAAAPSKKRLNTKEQRELAQLEQQIAALEARQAALAAQLATGGAYQAMQRWSEELAALGQQLDAAMERWVELGERA